MFKMLCNRVYWVVTFSFFYLHMTKVLDQLVTFGFFNEMLNRSALEFRKPGFGLSECLTELEKWLLTP